MSLVLAEGIVKSVGSGRGARRVLDGAGLALAGGEMVSILGRSGAGKSTMLNLLGGLDRPDAGSIVVRGKRIDRLPERGLTSYRGEHVGFVFQLFHLIGELTAEQNVTLPARITGGSGASRRRARELMERLGVARVADQPPHTLSGGEQQRVAIARALVNDPELILADEPTGNLDLEAAGVVLEILREIASEGRAVLMVTHDREATARSDRILTLSGGQLRA
ncbi:MAG: ABC transporter ATP-binding protein [Solirubrobacterales bacterium]